MMLRAALEQTRSHDQKGPTMTTIYAAIAIDSAAPTLRDMNVAQRAAHFSPRDTGAARARRCYTDTAHRDRMRALMDAAGLAGATVQVYFLKVEDCSLRSMTCEPCPGCDGTCQYAIVRDVELSARAGRAIFRRVNLDTIASLSIEFHAAQ